MEPMTLGSPVNSAAQSPSSPVTNYLPNFLLGDSTSGTRVNMSNPDSSRYLNSSLNLHSPISSYNNPELRNSRQRAMFGNNHHSPSNPQISTENHVGGPPTRGLFDTLEGPTASASSPPIATSVISPLNHHQKSLVTSGRASVVPFELQSNLSTNSNESQGLLQWVTVFGFPMSALNTIISYMSSRVRIIDKHPAPHPQCNWIHLKCSVEQEAQRALACNGDVVSGSIMIGVIPCTDESVILGSDKENRLRLDGSMRMFSTPVKKASTPFGSATPKSRIQGARPLVTNFPHTSPQMVKSTESVPQKSTGIVSKAMEYVFGW